MLQHLIAAFLSLVGLLAAMLVGYYHAAYKDTGLKYRRVYKQHRDTSIVLCVLSTGFAAILWAI